MIEWPHAKTQRRKDFLKIFLFFCDFAALLENSEVSAALI